MATETVHPPPLVAPLAAPEPDAAPPRRTGRRTTLREDWITTAFAATYVIGMVLDGRAHNREAVDTFFSVWHLIVYTGFTATVLWSA